MDSQQIPTSISAKFLSGTVKDSYASRVNTTSISSNRYSARGLVIRRQRLLFGAISAILIGGALSSFSAISSASAATAAKPGAVCKTEGAKALIAAKSYTCANISTTTTKKLVWKLAPSLGSVAGTTGGKAGAKGDGPGMGDGPDLNNPATKKALGAYSACLKRNGGVAMVPKKLGVRPTTPPTLSATQVKAEAACASLRPSFGPRHGGENEGPGGEGAGDDQGGGNMNGAPAPLVAPTKSPGA